MSQPWLGLLSGTSMDAASAVLCRPGPLPEVVATAHLPWPPALRERVRAFAAASPTPAARDAALEEEVGAFFATAAVEALAGREAAGVGFHGQTVAHRPDLGWTMQVGDPGVVAKATGLPVWSAFRDADIEEGGQGAPLVPLLDMAQREDGDPPTLRINLGGILNATFVPGEVGEPVAADIIACNHLLDGLWRLGEGAGPHDRDGRATAHGRAADPRPLAPFCHPFLLAKPPCSTHTDAWDEALRQMAGALAGVALEDRMATAARGIAEAVAAWVGRWCPQAPSRVVLAGGGTANAGLVRWLEYQLAASEVVVDPLAGEREGILFAWLAARAAAGRENPWPALTGAEAAAVLGRLWEP